MPTPRLDPAIAEGVVALARQGMRPAMIDRHYGGRVSIDKIHRLIGEARDAGAAIPQFKTGQLGHGAFRRFYFTLRPDDFEQLAAEAAARDLRPCDLAKMIVRWTLRGGHLGLVLEEGGPNG